MSSEKRKPSKPRPWTTKELAYVREHYPTEGGKVVGKAIGRPAASVHDFAQRHGIKCINQVGTYTLETIKARCIIDAEDGKDACWQWTGYIRDSNPSAWHDGRLQSMRKVALELYQGREIPRGNVVRASCTCGSCVNPLHAREMTRTQLLAENRKKEPPLRRIARLSAAAIARGEAVLDIEKAREIRTSSEPTKVMAQKYGVSEVHVRRIRNGKAWRDYSNHFAGLMIRGAA